MRARTASVLVWWVLALAGLLIATGGWLAAINVGTPIPDELGDVTPGSAARANASWRRRTRSDAGSSGICTTAPSSSSLRSP